MGGSPALQLTAAVVGDVHDLWDHNDEAALRHLSVDIVLFVGDFGNENVELVRRVAECPVPAAVCLGNHDAWQWGRRKTSDAAVQQPHDNVAQQLAALGDKHVGYSSMAVPHKQATVVGGRPFSWGGKRLRPEDLFDELYGVRSHQQSAKKIHACLQAAPDNHLLLMVAHNGPAGLGEAADDICGADFLPKAGDWGDIDLREALESAAEDGRVPALVAFGHMHDKICGTRDERRKRVVVDEQRGTVFLNAAVVPRVQRMPLAGRQPPVLSSDWPTRHHFCVATLQEWGVESMKDVWVSVQPDGQCHVVEETVLLTTEPTRPQETVQCLQAGAGAAGPPLVTRRVLDTSATLPTYNLATSPRIALPARPLPVNLQGPRASSSPLPAAKLRSC